MTDLPPLANPPDSSTARPVVLQVISGLEDDSAARSCVDMALFLRLAGGVPVVASSGGRLVHELERVGIRHIPLDLAGHSPLTLWANARLLADIIADEKVDIVHARTRAAAWSAFFAARRMGAAFLTTFQEAYPAVGMTAKFCNSIMARGERVIAISGFIAGHITAGYGVAPERIRTIAPGLDLFRFNPDHVTAERMARLAQEWRLKDGLKVILCPGRLAAGKGQDVLLRALAQLPRRDFVCVLAGREKGRAGQAAALEQMALDLDLEGHVTMVGECADMPTAYMLADVVAVPTVTPEGFGRVAIEAQAMGRPVVASNLGGMMEAVLPYETGWLVEAAHPEPLAGAINEALDLSAEQRQRLAARAISHVHQRYSKDQMGWQTLDVYAELYGQPVPWALADHP